MTSPAIRAPVVVTTDRASLTDALATVGLVVPTRPAAPALGGVLLRNSDGWLTLTGTDFDTTVSVRVPGSATDQTALVVDHREIAELLGALVKPSTARDTAGLPVTIRTTGAGTALVEFAGYSVPVTTYPVDDYPAVPETTPTSTQVDRETFTQNMARVTTAAGTDPALPMLTGVQLEFTPGNVALAATDRYRLAVATLPAISASADGKPTTALIPGRLIALVAKRFADGRVRLGWDSPTEPRLVSVTCGGITTVARTIDAEFPSYQHILPRTADRTVLTDRASLLAATRRAAAVLDVKRDRNKHVEVTITDTSVSVTPVLTEDTAAVTAPAQLATVDGITGTTRLRFAATYLADALGSFTADKITLHLQTGAARPVLLTDTPSGLTDTSAFRHLLMPIGD